MALLIAEARKLGSTIKDVCDWCIAENLAEAESEEEESNEEEGESEGEED